ncbi:hypothetical protein C1C91_23670 (plasmid) [Aeromonas caviae]|uniref:Uncharacterized protein n=1 Tax=Aeromonas caviae TaxID=648 RepID=A0A7D5UKU8_AERCA|nr:hypothetical protein [Aeromonas caviae]QLI60482.1 hypothetical protein C1C91_23670 [Aeromonas caviae]
MTLILGVLTVTIMIVLVLMLLLNKTADEGAEEKAIPHKLTAFEESKVINSDLAIASVPLPSEQLPGERGGRIEPEMSRPPDLDSIDSWPT